MSASNYSVTYNGDCATLSARINGTFIPLVTSTDRLQVDCIYRNILTDEYKNVRELCEDIHNNFSSQVTLLVLVTLLSTAHLNAT